MSLRYLPSSAHAHVGPHVLPRRRRLAPPPFLEGPDFTIPMRVLPKGATFHQLSSPPTEESPVLSIRHLPHRSATSLTSLTHPREERASWTIESFETCFTGDESKQPPLIEQSGHPVTTQQVINLSPTPSVNGQRSFIDPHNIKGLTGRTRRAPDLDSGLGSSIGSESPVAGPHDFTRRDGSHRKKGLTLDDAVKVQQAEQRGLVYRSTPTSTGKLVTSGQLSLGRFARKRIDEHILQPIAGHKQFHFLHSLIPNWYSRINKGINCLRDLEKALIFEPLKLASSGVLYRAFGEFSVQLILDTCPHLSETEQRQSPERPYDSGYFIDLVQQVGRLAAQIGAARQGRIAAASGEANAVAMDQARPFEVTLEGGIGQTGQPAELVRWTNGEGVSLRTNRRYEANSPMKRQHSNESLDDDAERSMGRRKKNADPTITKMKCSHPSCLKVFSRKCDLAKHQRVHSRPFKCPFRDCKYHEEGFAGEAERGRHLNDKHVKTPALFRCDYCPFQTKRDSNRKQHMEKKHGWAYDRAKVSGRAKKSGAPQTPQVTTMPTPSISDDSTSPFSNAWTPSSPSAGPFSGNDPLADPAAQALFPTPPSAGIAFDDPPGISPMLSQQNFEGHLAEAGPLGYPPHHFVPSQFRPSVMGIPQGGLNIDVATANSFTFNGSFYNAPTVDLPTSAPTPFQPHSRNPSFSGPPLPLVEEDLSPLNHQMVHDDEGIMNDYLNLDGIDSQNHDFTLFQDGMDSEPF